MDALAQGVQLYQQGKYTESLPLLTQAVQYSPQDPAAWTYLACTQLELNKISEALTSAEKALGLNEQYAPAWVARGRALGALDRPEEGLAACDHAISLDSRLASAHLFKGKILDHEGREQEALGEYEQALRIDGTSFEAIRCKGATLLELAELRQAEIVADRMIRLFPRAPQSWMLKAQSLADQERYEEAQQTLARAPQNSDVLMLQALIYGMAGDEGRARSILKQVTRNDPQNKEAAAVLAELQRIRNARALATGGRVAGGLTVGVVKGTGALVGGIIKASLKDF